MGHPMNDRLLNLNIDNLLNHPRADKLQENRRHEHFLSKRIGEQGHRVARIHFEHRSEQRRRQTEQYHGGEAAFAGKRLNFAPNLEAFADQVPDFIEDFREIAARLAL